MSPEMEAHSGTKMEAHSGTKMEAHSGTKMEAHCTKMEAHSGTKMEAHCATCTLISCAVVMWDVFMRFLLYYMGSIDF